jgi:hypothetical protein
LSPPSELPVCKHRGEPVEDLYPCASPYFVVPNGVSAEGCMRCPWPNQGESTRQVSVRAPCSSLLDYTGEIQACPTCSGTVHVKLRGCQVHGRCTSHKQLEGIACCRSCKDYHPGLHDARPSG